MMSFRDFLQSATFVIAGVIAFNTQAGEFEDPNVLLKNAQQYLQGQLEARYGSARVKADFEYKIMPLDTRLRLSKCDNAVLHTLSTPKLVAGQASIKISCSGTNPWSIFTPAQIVQFGSVAVATRSMARGEIVQKRDITFERQNLSQIGPNYVDAQATIIGLELKRPLREGEPLRLSYVDPPKIIQRGDQVALEAQTNGLSVVAPGTAMANGQMGERIRVKNTNSERIVDALVIAPGRVRVPY